MRNRVQSASRLRMTHEIQNDRDEALAYLKTGSFAESLMNDELKEAFLIAVENVIQQCLIPVPAEPLLRLGYAVAQSVDAVEASHRTMDADDRFADVFDCAQNIAWDFYVAGDEERQMALVDHDSLVVLADAVAAYRQAQTPKLDEVEIPVSAPHWESATPAVCGFAL